MSTTTPAAGAQVPGFSSPFFALYTHPVMRNTVKATCTILPGATMFSEPAVAAVLLDSQKGRRCDTCFLWRPRLQKCAGCKETYYCDDICARKLWGAHHSKLCKLLPGFPNIVNKSGFSPDPRIRQDVILLLQLVASTYNTQEKLDKIPKTPPNEHHEFITEWDSPASVFASLLPATSEPPFPLPHPLLPLVSNLDPNAPIPDTVLRYLAFRFQNNNFVCWHSDLNPFANAIFPLASRLFNHSCRPNAVPVYEIHERGLSIEIRAIKPIHAGDEITIAYLDPAIYCPARQRLLENGYGFICSCRKCAAETNLKSWIRDMPPKKDKGKRAAMNRELTSYLLDAQPETVPQGKLPPPVSQMPNAILIESVPIHLLRMFNATYLPEVSKRFSNQSHDGPFEMAVRNGRLILAMYLVHYTANYPIIGIHCHELSKVVWNEYMKYASRDKPTAYKLLFEALTYAVWGQDVLQVSVARGGDGSTPLPARDEAQAFVQVITDEWMKIGQ